MRSEGKMKLASGHTVAYLSGDDLRNDLFDYEEGLIRLTPGRWIFPPAYAKFADQLYGTKFRSGDVIIMTYPKCGTTWMQEILWTMRNNPDLDNPMAHLPTNTDRVPFIDLDMLMPNLGDGTKTLIKKQIDKLAPGVEHWEGLMQQLISLKSDPRTIKTHLPFSLLTPDILDTAKVVYVARNPKDLCISYYHHHKLFVSHNYKGTLQQFAQLFVDGHLTYGPYFEHVKEAWLKKDHPNMHFVFYENLKSDVMGELNKLNMFLGTSLSEKQITKVAKYTSFQEMKGRMEETFFPKDAYNENVIKENGGFFRKGDVGNWKKSLSPVEEAMIDNQWTKNFLSIGLQFKYEEKVNKN